MLAANVRTLAEHERAVADPDRLRPPACATCGCGRLHVHDYRTRKPRGQLGWPAVIEILRFRCAGCGAVWQLLPAFVARHLWRVWTTVGVILGAGSRPDVTVPKRTRRRWHARAATSARKLARVLATAGGELAAAVAKLAWDPSRRQVIDALGGASRLAEQSALIDRLAPGLRVM